MRMPIGSAMDKVLEISFFVLCGFIVSVDLFLVMMVRGAQKAVLEKRWVILYSVVFALLQIVTLKLSNCLGLWLRSQKALWLLPQLLLWASVIGLAVTGLLMIFRGYKMKMIPERRIEKLEAKPALLTGLLLGLDALVLGFLLGLTGILLHLAAALIITLATLVSAGIGASVGYRFGFAKQNLIHGIMASVLLLGAIGLGVLTLRS